MVTLNTMLQHARDIVYHCNLLLYQDDLSTIQREYIDAIYRNADRYHTLERDEAELVKRDGWHHTLRSPLAPIKGYVEILLMDAGGPISQEQRAILKHIRFHCDSMTAISDDLVTTLAQAKK